MEQGKFGEFGGQYVPEAMINALEELQTFYREVVQTEQFKGDLESLYRNYVGRPTPLYFAQKLTKQLKGAKIYLKREDLCFTGSHKINNALGQCLIAKRLGKSRVVTETSAGQHGLAVASAAVLLDLACDIFVGERDWQRIGDYGKQMELLGASIHVVTSGERSLKDAVSMASFEWVNHLTESHFAIGSAIGPHPFPSIVRDFQSVIGNEIKEQALGIEGQEPNAVVACLGGGSNAIGAFTPFISDEAVALYGCEAAGDGLDTDHNAASITQGRVGLLHGMKSYVCQDAYGQILPTDSIARGLRYPSVGPELAELAKTGRMQTIAVTDREAISAFLRLLRTEGIASALESAHAVAYAMRLAQTLPEQAVLVVNLSGYGTKDLQTVSQYLEVYHE